MTAKKKKINSQYGSKTKTTVKTGSRGEPVWTQFLIHTLNPEKLSLIVMIRYHLLFPREGIGIWSYAAKKPGCNRKSLACDIEWWGKTTMIYCGLHRSWRDEWSLYKDRKRGVVEWRHEGRAENRMGGDELVEWWRGRHRQTRGRCRNEPQGDWRW